MQITLPFPRSLSDLRIQALYLRVRITSHVTWNDTYDYSAPLAQLWVHVRHHAGGGNYPAPPAYPCPKAAAMEACLRVVDWCAQRLHAPPVPAPAPPAPKPEPVAPFKVGDRVRVKPKARARHRKMTSFMGTVVSVTQYGSLWSMRVRCDGLKTPRYAWAKDWELVPLTDWTADETVRALAQAVLDGDVSAWRPLVDRAAEILNELPT
jgi:hypothetical protein